MNCSQVAMFQIIPALYPHRQREVDGEGVGWSAKCGRAWTGGVGSSKFPNLCGHPLWMTPHSELFWSVFSCIWTEYGEMRSIQSECGKIQTRITPNTEIFTQCWLVICFVEYDLYQRHFSCLNPALLKKCFKKDFCSRFLSTRADIVALMKSWAYSYRYSYLDDITW